MTIHQHISCNLVSFGGQGWPSPVLTNSMDPAWTQPGKSWSPVQWIMLTRVIESEQGKQFILNSLEINQLIHKLITGVLDSIVPLHSQV